MGKALILLIVSLSLSGCSTFRQSPPPPNPVGLPCSVGPLRPDGDFLDRWTDDEVDQLLVINEAGEKLCGWTP